MFSKETLQYGRQIASAILGLDALYRQESGDQEGLVVVNMDVGGEVKAQSFASYAEAGQAFTELRDAASLLPEADRRCYYHQLCTSLIAFATWRERGLPFAEQLTRFIHVPAAPASDEELDSLCQQMRTLLTGMGFGGDLAQQCARWEASVRVPADEVPGVIAQLMDEAWDRVEAKLFKIPAPKSDGMRVTCVSGTAFNARCNYLERKVELNTDPVLTRPGLKHLTAHECYPGHYVQFKMRETLARQGQAPADNYLSVVNTAAASVFEGLGDNGLAAIDWIEDDNDRVQALMNRYRSGIGTAAAWRLHALGWKPDRVRDWLRERALVGGEGWVTARMAFISAPARAVLIWSYWWGETVVSRVWRRVAADRRPALLDYLYSRLHSNDSIAMFS